jgi:hypothetical protein
MIGFYKVEKKYTDWLKTLITKYLILNMLEVSVPPQAGVIPPLGVSLTSR